MNEKEFGKEEYLVQLKLVALLSVDEINELKEKIPALIKKRIKQYNYPYIIEQDNLILIHNTNIQAYINCEISKYNKITEKEKEFMNNEVAQVRKDAWNTFTENQSEKILNIYHRMEQELSDMFNNSPFFEKKFESSRLSRKKQTTKED